ncbi:GGDEF domain-containing protein [Massilia eurypsychrophila]|uniref:diguanylate cyclase n=1 Tax=Massilia eurypsychrophila TaxID=1485217 RepID=A0A2G8T945_9BURK|nr:GGDEF domain-containing response regulator [Massilia eurypsychrophila]PIL42586.1 GGDEF domain-containing protein [Massilia eurypsychrophila]
MSQQADAITQQVGLFLNPVAQRRVDFQASCGKQFGRLFLAEDAEQAAHILSQQQIDLLVIDLEHFDRSLDLETVGALVRQRNGAPVLLVCAFSTAGWLVELMASGPLDYVIGPVRADELNQRLASLASVAASGADELRRLLAMGSHVQQAVQGGDDQRALAVRICAALCAWPGVVHAAMFEASAGELALSAEHSPSGLDLERILASTDSLSQSSVRHVFPGLLAAFTGELALLDAPEKAGDPQLAQALLGIGAGMAIGVPILATGPGAPLGAISLLFARAHVFTSDELATLSDLAQLAAFGLRLDEMSRDAEQLVARLTGLATTDALTGVANRRRGEELLEQEVKRARRYRAPLALIAYDIDHFKDINDRYGHPCGDAALRIVGETTQAALRASDLLARSGGDQFQIVAAHTNAIDALKMAEKIRVAIAGTAFPGCDRLTISLAVAQLGDQESADSLMLRVSAALARAKRAGRNCVELAMR